MKKRTDDIITAAMREIDRRNNTCTLGCCEDGIKRLVHGIDYDDSETIAFASVNNATEEDGDLLIGLLDPTLGADWSGDHEFDLTSLEATEALYALSKGKTVRGHGKLSKDCTVTLRLPSPIKAHQRTLRNKTVNVNGYERLRGRTKPTGRLQYVTF